MAKNKLTETIDELIADSQAEEQKPKGPFRVKVVNPNEDGNQDLKANLREEAEREEIIRTPGTKKLGITDQRIVSVAGKSFKFQRRDPYGFWYIVPNKGRLPDELDQSFTTPTEAQKALEIYINKLD
jgi:hypothetical protein